jgi:hypothetical protein
VGLRPAINPRRIEVELLSRRWAHPAGATLPVLAPTLTTWCTGHLFALPLHDSCWHRVRGAPHRHASKREPTHQAGVTTAVVASPRDHARKRAPGATVLTAFDHPMLLSLQYAKGSRAPSYFPLSAIIDRCNARNQLSL